MMESAIWFESTCDSSAGAMNRYWRLSIKKAVEKCSNTMRRKLLLLFVTLVFETLNVLRFDAINPLINY